VSLLDTTDATIDTRANSTQQEPDRSVQIHIMLFNFPTVWNSLNRLILRTRGAQPSNPRQLFQHHGRVSASAYGRKLPRHEALNAWLHKHLPVR
jgi:hypothetical protein